ncbi:MAG TPA: nickel-dependent lactate racemase [Thermoplasmata archaeon]|jgi:nickel-dependent lactate racemase|nr:nickel-dependent lactate racemase [Thermoplasmata archaeon]
MQIGVPYGKGKQSVELADRNLGDIVYPKELPTFDEMKVLDEAIHSPLDSPSLKDFLQRCGRLLVIVNDATRPTPSGKVLRRIWPLLEDVQAEYLIATGMHREPSEDEYEFIFGDMYPTIKDRVSAHDSKKDEMVSFGTSKSGTPLLLNKKVADADGIIVIGSVEPHYFAGYTGGRKAFLPGVSAYETIENNHRHAVRIEAQALRLDGNPVHEDMMEMVEALADKPIFSIMVVLDRDHRMCAASAGDLDRSFHECRKMADQVFVVELKEKADVVVAVTSFPYDIDLYQSQKALDNAKYAVRDGGVIILVSACRKGVGADTFLKLLSSASTPKDALDQIAKSYKLGYHKAAKMAEIGLKGKMFAVTGLDPDIAMKAHMVPYKDLQSAVDAAISELGPDSKVTFIMDAVITVPVIR